MALRADRSGSDRIVLQGLVRSRFLDSNAFFLPRPRFELFWFGNKNRSNGFPFELTRAYAVSVM